MTQKFEDFAEGIKATWDEDTLREYERLSREYKTEVEERMKLGAAIAAARKSHNLSQPELALRSGVQQSEISRIERGHSNPTTATLIRLAQALGQQLAFIPAAV